MGLRPNKKNQEVQQLQIPEVSFTNIDDDESVVMFAERVAIGAFHSWVQNAGIDERRANNIINTSAENSASRLSKDERAKVIRRADIAIASTYQQIDELAA